MHFTEHLLFIVPAICCFSNAPSNEVSGSFFFAINHYLSNKYRQRYTKMSRMPFYKLNI